MKLPVCLALCAAVLLPQDKDPVLPDGATLEKDIVFLTMDDQELKLDIFLPKKNEELRPAILFIYGGGWSLTNRKQFHPQSTRLVGKGYVAVCIQHRSSTVARYPAAVQDCKAAVRWVRAHAKKYGIDPDRIAAAGGSSGGHLALMLGMTDDKTFEAVGDHKEISSRVRAVVAFNPATDFVAGAKIPKYAERGGGPFRAFLGVTFEKDPKLYEEASPITYVKKTSPPVLFLHGDKDRAVPYEQSVSMHRRLKELKVRTELFTAKNAGHGFFNGGKWFDLTLERMEKFLAEVLKK